jgi:hypothetical protein
MRHPINFVAFSTSVEESETVVKKILFSDISVHWEQTPERDFFSPRLTRGTGRGDGRWVQFSLVSKRKGNLEAMKQFATLSVGVGMP